MDLKSERAHKRELKLASPDSNRFARFVSMGLAKLVGKRHALGIVTRFFLGQGALQSIQIVVGLLLVRWLSVEALAQFGLATGLQATMSTLMDLGIASTVVPLIGTRREDRKLVGRYVRSAKYLRDKTFWILAPVTILAFWAMTYQHNWSWKVQLLLISSVLLSLYSSGSMSCFSPPLLIFRRLTELYVPQTITGLVRLVAYLVCRILGALNAWTAAALNALNIAVNGILLKKQSRKYLDWPTHDDSLVNREIIQYIIPATPAIIFAAFQGQISLFLISLFGSTVSIAQVTALGKLGQLFSVFMTFNVVIIEPYIAQIDRAQLLKKYVGFLILGMMFCLPITWAAFAFPTPFLWLLGPQYRGLRDAIGWVVLAACLNHISGLAWIMNRARKWVFWSGTILEIALLLIVQIAYILIIGVRTTKDAVFFTFTSSFCYVIAHGYVAIYGFLKGPRKSDSKDSRMHVDIEIDDEAINSLSPRGGLQ